MVSPSRRRPPGATGGVTTTKSLLTWSLYALFTTTVHAKVEDFQPSLVYRSATTNLASAESRRSQPGRSPPEVPLLQDTHTAKFRSTDENTYNRYQDALAPAQDDSAVRAPLAQSPESSPGLSALVPARLLQDWEAEDIILLSTIDGALHARDRKTGQPRWVLETPEDPMIETVHHPPSRLDVDDLPPQDDYMFIVEPSRDGQLYAQFMDPQIGLVKLPATVKKIATEVPFSMRVNGQYLATSSAQHSKSFTIDAATGEILYESPKHRAANRLDRQPRCRRRNDLELEDPACKPGRTIRIGRNQYTFTISNEQTGQDLCTIRFSEWVTNTGDNNLQQQYVQSLDGHDIQSYYNGRIIGIDSSASDDRIHRYTHMLGAPVARVFDVVRSRDDDDEDPQGLVVLSRPMDLPLSPVAQGWRDEMKSSQRVFINQTDQKSWYAMSEFSYPGVTAGAPMAGINWVHEGKMLDLDGDLKDIVGVHMLSSEQHVPPVRLTISPSPANDDWSIDQGHQIAPVEPPQSPATFTPPKSTGTDWLSIVLTMILSWTVYFLASKSNLLAKIRAMLPVEQPIKQPIAHALEPSTEVVTQVQPAKVETVTVPQVPAEATPEVVPAPESITPVHSRAQSTASGGSGTSSPRKRAKTLDHDDSASDGDSDNEQGAPDGNHTQNDGAIPIRKKRTKRGKRGGRNNKKKSMDPTTFDEKIVLAVEQHLDNGMVQVGRLKIDTREENCLGRGSNGTTVYPGSFEGREVAVKRLVKSTNDLAKKEIQHLMSSDENNHIIRYVSKEESRDFFYIALDKYTTSLDQFIEHPERYPGLVSGIQGFDVKDCLRQITDGVKHLHSLKLVHRDIKPQNILVKAVKSERPTQGLPKLHFVISDFGLCKPLEEGAMSTFAPTANHTAAGTTGWRAPELLVGPRDSVAAPTVDSIHSTTSTNHSTNHSCEGTVLDRPSGRRATKAIDIFSLGCVFYYVMSQGGHPFDKGGSSLGRDLNIKENNFTTDRLRLYKYEYDADDLILQMLKHNPKERPDCVSVLRHPYFWTPEQKLEFVCLISDSYEREKSSVKNIHDEKAIRTPDELASIDELTALESLGPNVLGVKADGTPHNFLTVLPKSFINEMGKQRKYTGTKMIDLLRAIRNKKNHRHDLPTEVKDIISGKQFGDRGMSWEGAYYSFWADKFPSLLINVHWILIDRELIGRFEMERWYES